MKNYAKIWDKLREEKPLIHCISNYVTVQDVANILLASGASPAMVENPKEAKEFAKLARAIYLNLGTLTEEQAAAMLEAAKGAAEMDLPLIIDPVACAVIPRKMEILEAVSHIATSKCIRGNTGEIKSLAGVEAEVKGVDSLDEGEGIEFVCKALALKHKAIIAATAAVDVVADGKRLARVENGSSLFASITGAGCMLTALIAACIAVSPKEAFEATISAILAFNIAGEKAAKRANNKIGSFRVALFDELYDLRGKDISLLGKCQVYEKN